MQRAKVFSFIMFEMVSLASSLIAGNRRGSAYDSTRWKIDVAICDIIVLDVLAVQFQGTA